MFINETHLPQLLQPGQYTDPEYHRQEVERLFMPGWHCIGSRFELPDDGSFITVDLLNHPVIVWRQGDEVHAYLNVCAHRFSMLTQSPCGHMDRLKCQYHGWEYDVHGDTKRIPDAKSFKPLERGKLGLTKLPCESVGQLIFVTLNQDPEPLRTFLGDAYAMCERLYSSTCRPVLACRRDNHANWKVALENSLEGYHLDEVHSSTFGPSPDADCCEHELHSDRHSALRVEHTTDTHLTKLGKWACRIAGATDRDLSYHQFHVYPNLVFAKFGVFSWMEAVYPVSSRDSYDTWRFFSNGGDPNMARGQALNWLMRQWGKRWFKKVLAEDEAIFPNIQDGLESPVQPGSGLVSIREERVFHFQNYVLNQCPPCS